MSKANFSDEFKRDAVAQITENARRLHVVDTTSARALRNILQKELLSLTDLRYFRVSTLDGDARGKLNRRKP